MNNITKKILPSTEQVKYQVIVDQIRTDMSFDEQLKILLSAWEMLPEPKLEWDYSVSLLKFLCNLCIKFEKFEESEQWLDLLMKSPMPELDTMPYVYGGIIMFHLGRFSEAMQMLSKAHEKRGNRALQSLPSEVRKFFNSRRGGDK
jgi:hypothetical protein